MAKDTISYDEGNEAFNNKVLIYLGTKRIVGKRAWQLISLISLT